jgi:hypothetical protein
MFDWNKSFNFKIKCALVTTQGIKRASEEKMQILALILAKHLVTKFSK